MADPVLPPAGDIPKEGMPSWVIWLVVSIVSGVLLSLLAISFVTTISSVIKMIIFAEFVALALEPGVNWLASRGWRRGVATATIMLVIVAAVLVFVAAILPTLVKELASFFTRLPDLVESLADRFGLDLSAEGVSAAVTEQKDQLAQAAGNLARGVLQITGWVAGLLASACSVGLIAFYLATDAPRVRRTVCSLLPERRQMRTLQLWEIAIEKVGGYLYSRALMALVSGVASYGILRILGVPFAAPMALFVGFTSQFVPVIGTYIAYAVPVGVALASQGLGDAVWLLVFVTVYQQFENIILSPRLSARTMKLHPAVAFVAALIGGAIGGIGGAFLSLPVAAIVQAFGSTFLQRYEVVESDLTREIDPVVAKAERSERKESESKTTTWFGRLRARINSDK